MQICCCGWYFWENTLKILRDSGYSTVVIAHRDGNSQGLNMSIIENIGLEFHCYDYFLKNYWDHVSSVFWCHDDIYISQQTLDSISQHKGQVTFIWQNKKEAKYNRHAHGRGILTSSDFLHFLLNKGGFWYDDKNKGDTHSKIRNQGIRAFEKICEDTSINHLFIRDIRLGRRGKV